MWAFGYEAHGRGPVERVLITMTQMEVPWGMNVVTKKKWP